MNPITFEEQTYIVTLVDRAFADLNITPYSWQETSVYHILLQFIHEKKRNIILSADTGVGKSMIGAAVAIAMAVHLDIHNKPVSTVMMQNNLLVDQYAESLATRRMFMSVKGASNFDCEFGTNGDINAINCKLPALQRAHKKKEPTKPMPTPSECSSCKYHKQKLRARMIPHIITNFQYHLTKTIKGRADSGRAVSIFDEAHTLSDVAVDSMMVELSSETFINLIKIIDFARGQYCQVSNFKLVSVMKALEDTVRKCERTTNFNIMNEDTFIDIIRDLRDAMMPVLQNLNSDHLVTESYDGVDKAIKRFDNYHSSYAMYFSNCNMTEYVYDYDTYTKACTIKPVFVKGLGELILSEYNLFMSATVTKGYMVNTIGLDPKETHFIPLPAVFDKANKPIAIIAKGSVNYKTLQSPNTIRSLASDVAAIVHRHILLRQSGIAMVNSFKLGQDLYDALPVDIQSHVVLHEKGTKVNEAIDIATRTSNPTLLISPSIFEGVDFKGDRSNYQILLKAPYPSLGDARIKIIANHYGSVYRTITLMKIIQGLGRSVRSADEVAITYVLDRNIGELLMSPTNSWKHTHTLFKTAEEALLSIGIKS